MGKTELFSYLSAFVTIVLAVALGDMIHSLHRLLRARARVRWDARPLVLAVLIALGVVSEFFSLWLHLDVTQISMMRLLWLLATPMLFALLAYAALPDEVPVDGLDLSQFWDGERRYLLLLWGIAIILDLLRSIERAWPDPARLEYVAIGATPILIFGFLGLAGMWFARGRVWSWVALVAYATFVLLGVAQWKIALHPG